MTLRRRPATAVCMGIGRTLSALLAHALELLLELGVAVFDRVALLPLPEHHAGAEEGERLEDRLDDSGHAVAPARAAHHSATELERHHAHICPRCDRAVAG